MGLEVILNWFKEIIISSFSRHKYSHKARRRYLYQGCLHRIESGKNGLLRSFPSDYRCVCLRIGIFLWHRQQQQNSAKTTYYFYRFSHFLTPHLPKVHLSPVLFVNGLVWSNLAVSIPLQPNFSHAFSQSFLS